MSPIREKTCIGQTGALGRIKARSKAVRPEGISKDALRLLQRLLRDMNNIVTYRV